MKKPTSRRNFLKLSGAGIAASISSKVAEARSTEGRRTEGSTRASVSIPVVGLATLDRVVGFRIQIRSGRIVSVRDVPIGWDVSIQNDPSWNTTVEGSIIAGAAAVSSGFFRDFLIVEKNESLGGSPFDITGDVVASTDFKTERHIAIKKADFALGKAQ